MTWQRFKTVLVNVHESLQLGRLIGSQRKLMGERVVRMQRRWKLGKTSSVTWVRGLNHRPLTELVNSNRQFESDRDWQPGKTGMISGWVLGARLILARSAWRVRIPNGPPVHCVSAGCAGLGLKVLIGRGLATGDSRVNSRHQIESRHALDWSSGRRVTCQVDSARAWTEGGTGNRRFFRHYP